MLRLSSHANGIDSLGLLGLIGHPHPANGHPECHRYFHGALPWAANHLHGNSHPSASLLQIRQFSFPPEEYLCWILYYSVTLCILILCFFKVFFNFVSESKIVALSLGVSALLSTPPPLLCSPPLVGGLLIGGSQTTLTQLHSVCRISVFLAF